MTQTKKPAALRKDAHIDLALTPETASAVDNSLDRLNFTHCALPEIDLDDIDCSTHFLDHHLSAPILIGAMTGGTPRAEAINAALARAAQDHKIGLAVGSQRAALELGQTARNLRDAAPDIPIIGNLGGVQLAQPGGLDLARAAVDDLQANAIAIHLNPLQEVMQPEGDRDWRGVTASIEALVKTEICPVIVKEVGAGISAKVAATLFDIGVAAVDVAGLGGTNWARIEARRRADDGDALAPFFDWGVPTLDCLTETCNACPGHTVIASGGVRHGLDAMRAYWLGADMVSVAGPVLKHLLADDKQPDDAALYGFIAHIKQQIAVTLFLTGARNLKDLRHKEARLDGAIIDRCLAR